ncbi:interferon regulatory factor 2 isoform 2-T6 [Cyanocitta cristata]
MERTGGTRRFPAGEGARTHRQRRGRWIGRAAARAGPGRAGGPRTCCGAGGCRWLRQGKGSGGGAGGGAAGGGRCAAGGALPARGPGRGVALPPRPASRRVRYTSGGAGPPPPPPAPAPQPPGPGRERGPGASRDPSLVRARQRQCGARRWSGAGGGQAAAGGFRGSGGRRKWRGRPVPCRNSLSRGPGGAAAFAGAVLPHASERRAKRCISNPRGKLGTRIFFVCSTQGQVLSALRCLGLKLQVPEGSDPSVQGPRDINVCANDHRGKDTSEMIFSNLLKAWPKFPADVGCCNAREVNVLSHRHCVLQVS